MPEKDGKTRVYVQGGNPDNASSNLTAWQLYPERTNPQNAHTGQEAREINGRADYVCVNSETFARRKDGKPGFGEQLSDEYGVYPTDGSEPFRFNKMGIPWDKEAEKLAKELEKRAGKKGITIITR